ncbi:MAG: M1 family metallopeptidase [Chloroherpetonaceae bacterium]|nr:M1 family metallopeptidase [Chloroherpetonaceae bacterium]MDW8437822.1 M1 family metallopeptidase [Chloroherpetonaceae bacterium]
MQTLSKTVFAFFSLLALSACSSPNAALNDHKTNPDSTADVVLEPIQIGAKRAPLHNESVFRRLDWTLSPYRTASGAPSHLYWQNRADYVIQARLDTLEHVLTGSEIITYTNFSPDTLRYVWVQLDQNLSNPKMRPRLIKQADDPTEPSLFRSPEFDGGIAISRVEVAMRQTIRKGKRTASARKPKVAAPYKINDTMMRIDLPEPLAPQSQVDIEIDWSFAIPFTGRMGREQCQQGWIYQIAQWYPRMCVYDDVSGWNTDQYLGAGEFYTEYGSFDVKLTVPANHICLATGTLQNPSEVLTPILRERLARAAKSDSTVMIISREEVGKFFTRPKQTGELVWHYKADNVRDFAFASSGAFIWDAAQWNGVLAQSLYPVEAQTMWKESTQYVRFSLKEFSEKWFPYPYPTMINVNGAVPGGMEYPMMIFCRERYNDFRLFAVTLHEVGHTWFPMIVQNNERRHAWLDEGLNSFICYYGEKEKYPARKARRGEGRDIVPYMRSPEHQPIMTHPHAILDLGQNAYAKTAAALVALREVVLGEERFDFAFRTYIERWKYKHPTPEDFFRTMEDASGEDLSWFWRGWFYTTSLLDQAVDSVHSLDSLDQVYNRVFLTNRKEMAMPVEMEITYADGTKERRKLPVEIWLQGNLFVAPIWSHERIVGVEIDPDKKLPDIDLSNNALFDPKWRERQGKRKGKNDADSNAQSNDESDD